MSLKAFLKDRLPPRALELLRSARQALFLPSPLAYAPMGWRTDLGGSKGFRSPTVVSWDLREAEPLIRRLQAGATELFEPPAKGWALRRALEEHNWYMTLAYALAAASPDGRSLKVLDYGSGPGQGYWIARTLLPGLSLDYHCMDLPEMAAEGRRLTPGAQWHPDDRCLADRYDLVLFSNVLQYFKEWRGLLRRGAAASKRHLLLAQVPTVEKVPSFVAVQRRGGERMLHNQFNRDELLGAALECGLRMTRGFLIADQLPVSGAPEQPIYRGWLFERKSAGQFDGAPEQP